MPLFSLNAHVFLLTDISLIKQDILNILRNFERVFFLYNKNVLFIWFQHPIFFLHTSLYKKKINKRTISLFQSRNQIK